MKLLSHRNKKKKRVKKSNETHLTSSLTQVHALGEFPSRREVPVSLFQKIMPKNLQREWAFRFINLR